MSKYTTTNDAWVDADGSYGGGAGLLIFKGEDLTYEQWEIVANLSDSDRLLYIKAVLDGEDTTTWE